MLVEWRQGRVGNFMWHGPGEAGGGRSRSSGKTGCHEEEQDVGVGAKTQDETGHIILGREADPSREPVFSVA